MEQKKQELKIELSPEVAAGHYSNFTIISHGPEEFFLDFVTMAPNMPQAKVQSRIIMTPENAKNLLMALVTTLRNSKPPSAKSPARCPVSPSRVPTTSPIPL